MLQCFQVDPWGSLTNPQKKCMHFYCCFHLFLLKFLLCFPMTFKAYFKLLGSSKVVDNASHCEEHPNNFHLYEQWGESHITIKSFLFLIVPPRFIKWLQWCAPYKETSQQLYPFFRHGEDTNKQQTKHQLPLKSNTITTMLSVPFSIISQPTLFLLSYERHIHTDHQGEAVVTEPY